MPTYFIIEHKSRGILQDQLRHENPQFKWTALRSAIDNERFHNLAQAKTAIAKLALDGTYIVEMSNASLPIAHYLDGTVWRTRAA